MRTYVRGRSVTPPQRTQKHARPTWNATTSDVAPIDQKRPAARNPLYTPWRRIATMHCDFGGENSDMTLGASLRALGCRTHALPGSSHSHTHTWFAARTRVASAFSSVMRNALRPYLRRAAAKSGQGGSEHLTPLLPVHTTWAEATARTHDDDTVRSRTHGRVHR